MNAICCADVFERFWPICSEFCDGLRCSNSLPAVGTNFQPIAVLLHVPKERIYANNLLFKDSGEFAGFDASEPTSRSGGKAKVIEKIKEVTCSTSFLIFLDVSDTLDKTSSEIVS
jgi:hypothetical protein